MYAEKSQKKNNALNVRLYLKFQKIFRILDVGQVSIIAKSWPYAYTYKFKLKHFNSFCEIWYHILALKTKIEIKLQIHTNID